MVTKQEHFDKVANHLLTQNKKALDKTGKCVYRAPDGTKCAIGCLIPDELYSPKLESRLVFQDIFDPIFGHLTYEERNMLDDLQHVHDKSNVENWKEDLRNLANRWNLEWTLD